MSAEPIPTGADDSGTTLSDCLRNWRDELASIAREVWAPIAREGARTISISFSAFGTAISRVEYDGETQLCSIPPDSADTARLVASALSQAGIRPRSTDVAITLPAGEVLRPRVRLPYVPHRAIRSMLGYELEHLSPLHLEELYFDFRVVARERKANRTEVDLRIIKRNVIRDALKVVHTAGFSVGAILFEHDELPSDWRHFPVDLIGYLRRYWRRQGVVLLAGLSILLLITVGLGAYARGAAARDSIEDQIETERLEAVQVEHIRHDIDSAHAQIEFAAAQKMKQPSLLTILSGITGALPDGTWLTSLKVEGKKIHAQGYSHAASDLIGLIDRSPQFANAQFNAPIMQSSNKLDRFDITFDIKTGAP